MKDRKIHVAVGFYPDGSYVVNYVRDEDIGGNILYNITNRPGRFYFVDGEHVGGGTHPGCPAGPAAERFITECKRRLAAIDTGEPTYDTRPYR